MNENKGAPWDIDAARVQTAGRITDENQTDTYSDDAIRRAIVYTRQDVVLLVVYLSWINRHLRNITWILGAILFILGVNFIGHIV